MNTKLLAPLVGALLLGGSTLALAGNRHDDDRGHPQARGWHQDNWSRPERHWHQFQQYRHYDPRPRAYWAPAPIPPRHPSAYRSYGWGPRAYDRDGVTVIFRGRLN